MRFWAASGTLFVRAKSSARRQEKIRPYGYQHKLPPSSRQASGFLAVPLLRRGQRSSARHLALRPPEKSAAPWPRPTHSRCWRNAPSRAVATVTENQRRSPGSTRHASRRRCALASVMSRARPPTRRPPLTLRPEKCVPSSSRSPEEAGASEKRWLGLESSRSRFFPLAAKKKKRLQCDEAGLLGERSKTVKLLPLGIWRVTHCTSCLERSMPR